MPADISLHPQARRDIVEQARYIAEDNPDAADRFLDFVEQALSALADMPHMGALRTFDNPALERIRMWPIKGFEKHLIFYRQIAGGIEIIRVLHGARDIEALLNQEGL